jgi:hypothetical protein
MPLNGRRKKSFYHLLKACLAFEETIIQIDVERPAAIR